MKEFIKNVLDVDVDAVKGTVKYTISEMYDEIDEEGVAEIKFKLIDEFTMTFNEIKKKEEQQGHSMGHELHKKYGIPRGN
ncbi:hypothetical protein [Bacillus safensis]|uniref:Uncharacterized protein n=1 Tax=Bacillus safensis TaxID=561879 RepID=A0A1L6ZP93_BACIA|nr:hypothetical protein [Bacillus safensis]APT48325.1 hypothetical protein BSA145_20900 [Bacillus safensis]